MLALTRKKNESVVINGDVKIVVVEIRGDKVRLGIEAPADVPVFRSEVWAKIQAGESVKNATTGAESFDLAPKTEEKERGLARKSRKQKTAASNRQSAQIFAENFAEKAEFVEKTLRRRGDETDDFDDIPVQLGVETESTDGDPTSICRSPFE